MCFSAAASFGIAAVLLPAGAYCVTQALRKNRALLGLAAIPFIFSIQQFCEGMVWRGIDQGDRELARGAAYGFLFFALAFWPCWIPACAFLTDENRRRKGFLALLSVLGLVGGLTLYLPLVFNPAVLEVTIANHSVCYDFAQSVAFRYLPIISWQIAYASVVALPLLIAPSRGFFHFGVALLTSATICHFFYWTVFVSVWCFFAAILSLYLCFLFRMLALPDSRTERTPSSAGPRDA